MTNAATTNPPIIHSTLPQNAAKPYVEIPEALPNSYDIYLGSVATFVGSSQGFCQALCNVVLQCAAFMFGASVNECTLITNDAVGTVGMLAVTNNHHLYVSANPGQSSWGGPLPYPVGRLSLVVSLGGWPGPACMRKRRGGSCVCGHLHLHMLPWKCVTHSVHCRLRRLVLSGQRRAVQGPHSCLTAQHGPIHAPGTGSLVAMSPSERQLGLSSGCQNTRAPLDVDSGSVSSWSGQECIWGHIA